MTHISQTASPELRASEAEDVAVEAAVVVVANSTDTPLLAECE